MGDKKNERKHFLLSRKWWSAIIGAVIIPLNQLYGMELPSEALVLVAISITAYILGESKVDIEAIKAAKS